MPKVSDEHKEQRRHQILHGARRAFARHGYDGATVARLEEETGLSRGAIFNYYPNKESIFVDLALESSARLTEIWLSQGFRALLDAITHEDPDWLGVQLEASRRIHTDPAFRELVAEAEAKHRREKDVRLARLQALGMRDDISLETIAVFLSLVANGLALRRTMGDPMPDLDEIAELVDRGVSAEPRKRATPRRSVRATPRRS